MLEEQPRKRARKGTKSCTECRRRKVRCTRYSEDTQTCRGCEERGLECVEQKYSSQPLQTKKLSSRHRISQLESKFTTLSKVVHNLELQLGHQPTDISEQLAEQVPATDESDDDDDDDDGSVSDVLAADQPSHLRSLFHNDWLSVDTDSQNELLQGRKAKASAHILDIARHALQKLIPSKEEVLDVARSAFRWLSLHHSLLPQPFMVKSQQEIIESYDDMHKSDVQTISLASWLLTVVITAQQVPQEPGSTGIQLRRYQRCLAFSRAVSDTVERTILAHDRVISTLEGLGVAMLSVRAAMGQGNFQKAWIRLRHYIAIAELMGLHKSFQAVQLNTAHGGQDHKTQLHRAQLWELICAADKLLGMLINLPPGTRRYQQIKVQEVTLDGVVQPQLYLARLMDTAAKIQQVDDMNTTQGLSPELYATVLELARELRVLASQTPKSWWVLGEGEQVKPDHVVQFLHYCMVMRVHLPFTMRQNPGEEYFYSCLACMDACESVVQRYQFLRRNLPPGIFIAQVLDLQAFTATIVLLLMTHSSIPMDRFNWTNNKARLESVVAQVVKLMDERSDDMIGSDFARKGVTTIRSLNKLLQQDENDKAGLHVQQELMLKVPLLGKVNIRRNARPSSYPSQPSQPPSSSVNSWSTVQAPSELGSLKSNANKQVLQPQPSQQQQQGPPPPPPPPPLLHTDTAYVEAAGLQTPAEARQFDPFSWFIEDNQENFFQDALMADSSDHFAPMWQNTNEAFQFGS